MISIIVPVYNVEQYLEKCMDSIINQTYKDLEILVVDDGSTDNSGVIADEYAEKDGRIRVFHTRNQGLSCARNLGLKEAHGEWIGFVDSDDWIEANMYEMLLEKAEETGADVVECGIFRVYTTRTIEKKAITNPISGIDALEALIRGDIQTQVWNKLWRKTIFNEERFPIGCDYEDIATTHKLIETALVTGVPHSFYHYIQRNSSISQDHGLKNLKDYWKAHKCRYEDLKDKVDVDSVDELLKNCAYAIARVWAWYLGSENNHGLMAEMSAFTHENFPVFGRKEWPITLRVYTFLSRFNSSISFLIAYVGNQLYRLIKPRYFG